MGESGCGKTTTGNLLLGLLPPTGGRVILDGEEVGRMSGRALQRLRRRVQMVFQDPYESLNPRMRVRDIVAEPLRVHRVASGAELRERVEGALTSAGLTPVSAYARRFPFELSGGQRQRVVIAAALALEPSLLIAGQNDRVVPPPATRWLADALPDARFHQIERAAHAPFISHVEEVALLLRPFLAGIARETGNGKG